MENTPEGPRSKEADGDTLLIEDVEVRPISDPQDPLQKVIPNGHQDSCQDKPQDNPQESPQDRPQSIPQERPQERTQDISEEIHTEQSTPTPDEDQPQDDWVHELHTAIENNDADAVATLLDNDGALEQLYFYRFNLEFDVEYGVTPLTLAAGLGLGSIVQLLLDRGANILTKTTNTESTAFFTAIRNGHKHIVEMLFNKGGSELLEEPNDSGRMPFGAAARNGHADVLKLLIDKGANTNYADDKGYTALHLASMQEDPAIVKFLLDNGAEIHTANAEGLTALHFAAEYQQTACINTLLAGGADPATAQADGYTALHIGARFGHLDVVKLLFKAKPEILSVHANGKETPLMKAAKHGNIPIVDFFLSHGADINAKDSQEGTALHYAAAGGHLSMVRRLLKQEKGLLDIRDVSDNTALLLALHCGHASVAKYLLDRGADTSTKAPEDWTALHYAARKGYFYIARQILKRNKSLLDMRTIENDTALTLATFGGHIAIVDCLLSHGADIHAKDSKDWTSFHLAASEGHLKILQRLLKRDLEILELRTSEDDTALTLATYEGHTAIVEYLISRGADIYAKDSDGRTAWHLSAVKGHSEIMMLLFQRDKNLLETEDSNQTTALLLAGQFGRASVANYLLSIGANIDARNSETDTAIHLAAESGSLDIVELILQARPDLLESRGFTGDTPISVALKLRHSAVFEFLFDKGADIIATNEEDDTPFHIAATKGHFQIIKRMLDRDPSILNAKGYKGRTAILSALMADHVVSEDLTTSGNLLIFEYLFEKGADISIADEHADLPLHFAVSRGYPTAVEQILERKPDLIEAKGHMGRTALSLALFQDQLNIVDSLLEKGADIAVLDDEDNNSLHAAAWGGHLNAAEEILKKKPDLINEKGNGGRTALSFALFRGHLDVFDFLFDKGAEITVDEEGVTPFHLAAKGGYLQAVEKIFRSRSDLLNSKDDDGQTALIKASEDGHVDVATYLLKEGADITLKSNNGRTALHMACEDGSVEICKLLLGSYSRHGSLDAEKSFITARDDWDDTALIDGSVNGRLSVVLLLLETEVLFPQYPANVEPYVSFEEEINEVETLLLARLKKGETDEIHERIEATIYWAILNGRGDLLSECLSKLLDTYDMNGWERGGFSCAHVAALGGHVEMMEQLLLNGVCTLAPTLNGISPFHLAVKYNRLDLVKKLIIWLGASPGGGVSESEVDVTVVLRQVLHDEDSVLDTILRKQDDDHTSISLAALGMNERHRELQDFLWDALDKSIDETLFVSPMRDQAHLVLELAAQYETPGDEKYLAKFLKLIPTPLTYHSRGLNVLHLAVHHRLPTVVWCLLSNGSYLSRTHIDTAQSIVSMFEEKDEHGIVTKDVIGDVIKGILESPPPLRRQQAWRREERLPDYEYQDQHEDWPEGTVLDFFREGDQASLQVKRRPMSTIIYTAGPHNIMKAGQYRNLKSLKKALSAPGDFPEATSKKRKEKPTSEPKRRNDNTPAIPMEKSGALPTRSAEKDKAVAEERRTLDLRWIHIHANNLRCVEDLMVRISRDKEIKIKHHHPWAQFVRESWVELPAGGSKFYMKPQCIYDRRSTTLNDSQPSNMGLKSALYMPYLFWKKCPAESTDNTEPRLAWLRGNKIAPNAMSATSGAIASSAEDLFQLRQDVQSGQKQLIVHEPMTLDQYYYVSLEDTSLRDQDQVLWRATNPELKSSTSEKIDDQARSISLPRASSEQEKSKLRENPTKAASHSEPELRKILIVNQLWLWVLDDNTIITSTTEDIDKDETSFLQLVVSAFRAQKNISSVSVEFMKDLILRTATGLFYKKEIDVLGKRKSPLDVYREAILTVREDEARLFDEFARSLKKGNPASEGKARRARRSRDFDRHDNTQGEYTDVANHSEDERFEDEFERRMITKNPYDNISEETELLREVKDISDELNMLKNLAEDQEDVWKQVWKDEHKPDSGFTHEIPSDIEGEIEEMIKEADFVQQAINALLDLKQKQANIVEAKYTRKQSDDTAVQGDTIMVFTVVTILFLPASFLTSLLALNISSFPHVGGDVKFQGRLIFPIIFGASIAVSGLFALIAFNASKLKRFFFGSKRDPDAGTPASSSINLSAEISRRSAFNQPAKRRFGQKPGSQAEPRLQELNVMEGMDKKGQERSSFAGSFEMV